MKKLSVPENISLKKEFLRGLGVQELLQLLLAVVPILVGVVIFWCVEEDPGPRLLALVGLLIYVTICYAIFSTPDGNQSIFSFVTRWIHFLRTQKFYRYRQEKEALYLADKKESI